MKFSKKRLTAMDKAVDDSILNLRLQVSRPSNIVFTKEAFEAEILKFQLRLKKALDAALEIERD